MSKTIKNVIGSIAIILALVGAVLFGYHPTEHGKFYTQQEVDSLLQLEKAALLMNVDSSKVETTKIEFVQGPTRFTKVIIHDTISFDPVNIEVRYDTVEVEVPLREYTTHQEAGSVNFDANIQVIGEFVDMKVSNLKYKYTPPPPCPTPAPCPKLEKPKGLIEKIKFLVKKQ